MLCIQISDRDDKWIELKQFQPYRFFQQVFHNNAKLENILVNKTLERNYKTTLKLTRLLVLCWFVRRKYTLKKYPYGYCILILVVSKVNTNIVLHSVQ